MKSAVQPSRWAAAKKQGCVALTLVVCIALVVGQVRPAVADERFDKFGNIATSLGNVTTQASSLAALAFSIGAILKFKQHKDNPTEIPVGTPIALLFLPSILNMAGSTHSCPVFVGSGTLLGEDTCIWGKLTGEVGTQSDSSLYSVAWRTGGQYEIGPGWFLGGALGTSTSSSSMPSGPSSTGRSYEGAIVLKRVDGPWYFAGAVGASNTTDENVWPVPTRGAMVSSVSTFNAAMTLRGAYQVVLDPVYLRPRVDVGLGWMNRTALREQGPSTALNVDPVAKAGVVITPALEIGGRIDWGSVILRPYIAGGPSIMPDNTHPISGSLGGTPFSATVQGPTVVAVFEAGLQVYQAKSWEAKLEYRGSATTDYLDQSLGLRFARHF